jgi:plastocyanin
MITRYVPLVLALAVFTVHIKDFKFVPPALTVPAGSTVTFVNDDTEPHTATADDKSFDSEAIDTSETWKHTFAKPGTFAYFCEMHPMMKGTLTVKAAL